MRPYIAILACVSKLGVACAADAAATQEKAAVAPVQELRKISITATRGARELDGIAGTVTVKSAEEIEAELANDIKDLVRYEPGISVANAPARFGLAGFNIRGIDGNRVLIRIDDVRMADAFSIGSFSSARRNLVDLDAVKSVEFVRGAASALYGSNAIGGVVSFVMKDPADYLQAGRNTYFAAKTGYQSDDEGWFSGGTFAFGGDALRGIVLYTHREGGEINNQGSRATQDSTRTEPNPQDYDSDAVLAKVDWDLNDAHRLRLTVEADDGDVQTDVFSGVGISGTTNVLSLTGDDRQRRVRVSVGHEANVSAALFDTMNWQLYRQTSQVEQLTHETRYTTTSGPASTVRRDREFEFDQALTGGELILRKDFMVGGSEHALTYGIDLVHTETEQSRNGVQTTLASGARTSNIPPDNFPVRDFPNTTTRAYATYVQDEIGVGAWRLVPGVRVDRYELDPKPDAIFSADNPGVTPERLARTSVAPKFGVVYDIDGQWSAFAQYARGFRAPPYNDVNIGFTNLAFGYTAIPNPDLKPETSDGYEIGLRSDYGATFFALTGFYNDYSNFIQSQANIGTRNGLIVFQSQNLAEARIYGAEFRAGVDLQGVADALTGWRVKSSVAYARGDNRTTDQPLNSVDPLKAVLGIAYAPADGRWGIELVGTAVDRKSRIDRSVATSFVSPGYVTLDLLAHAAVGERLRLKAGIFNLTDKHYWEWSDVRDRPANDPTIDRYSRPGLNAGASVTVQF
jgi:hemoglobin/transferrin/lactoferrin receptor protein